VAATRLVAEARLAAAQELRPGLGVPAAPPVPPARIERARALCERFFPPAEADRVAALLRHARAGVNLAQSPGA
jgi:hypothetical protein